MNGFRQLWVLAYGSMWEAGLGELVAHIMGIASERGLPAALDAERVCRQLFFRQLRRAIEAVLAAREAVTAALVFATMGAPAGRELSFVWILGTARARELLDHAR